MLALVEHQQIIDVLISPEIFLGLLIPWKNY